MSRETIKKGLVNLGKGCGMVLETMVLAAGAIMSAGYEAEEKIKESDSYGNMMDAILKSDIISYYQKEIIEKVANKELTEQQRQSIIAICESDMSGYYKYESVNTIIE